MPWWTGIITLSHSRTSYPSFFFVVHRRTAPQQHLQQLQVAIRAFKIRAGEHQHGYAARYAIRIIPHRVHLPATDEPLLHLRRIRSIVHERIVEAALGA